MEHNEIKATTSIDLIMEAARLNKKSVEVTFYSAYNDSLHCNLSDKMKESLKTEKVSVFNVIDEVLDIMYLMKSKYVKSIKWVN